MTQRELDCAVADATGEDLCEIRRRGFRLADAEEIAFDPEPCGPRMIDGDALDSRRRVTCQRPRLGEPVAA